MKKYIFFFIFLLPVGNAAFAQLSDVENKIKVTIGKKYEFKPFIKGLITYLGKNQDGYCMMSRKIKDIYIFKFNSQMNLVATKSMKELTGVSQKVLSSNNFIFQPNTFEVFINKGSKKNLKRYKYIIDTKTMEERSNSLHENLVVKQKLIYNLDSSRSMLIELSASKKNVSKCMFTDNQEKISLEKIQHGEDELYLVGGSIFENKFVAVFESSINDNFNSNEQSTYIAYWDFNGKLLSTKKVDDDTYNLYQQKYIQTKKGVFLVGVTRFTAKKLSTNHSSSFFIQAIKEEYTENQEIEIHDYPLEVVKYLKGDSYEKSSKLFQKNGWKLGVGNVDAVKVVIDQEGNIFVSCQPKMFNYYDSKFYTSSFGVIVAKFNSQGNFEYINYLPNRYSSRMSTNPAEIGYAILANNGKCYVLISGDIAQKIDHSNPDFFKGMVIAESNDHGLKMNYIYQKEMKKPGLVVWVTKNINHKLGVFSWFTDNSMYQSVYIECVNE